jgi:hypothetical protein
MYIVINKTKKTTWKIKNGFPNMEKYLNDGDKIIIISLYSNTIKVPYAVKENGIVDWKWEEYRVDRNVLESL